MKWVSNDGLEWFAFNMYVLGFYLLNHTNWYHTLNVDHSYHWSSWFLINKIRSSYTGSGNSICHSYNSPYFGYISNSIDEAMNTYFEYNIEKRIQTQIHNNLFNISIQQDKVQVRCNNLITFLFRPAQSLKMFCPSPMWNSRMNVDSNQYYRCTSRWVHYLYIRPFFYWVSVLNYGKIIINVYF